MAGVAAAKSPTTGRVTRREVRRAEIIAAARELVADGGLQALTFSALEAALPFTRGVITYHFANKDELAFALLQDAVAIIDAGTLQAVEAEVGLENRVRAAVGTTVAGFLEHRGAGLVLMSFWGKIPKDARVSKLNADLYRSWRQASAVLIRQGIEAGVVDPETNVDAVSALMVGTVVGIVCQIYWEDEAFDPQAAVDVAAAGLALNLRRPPKAL